jgi:RNA polymerase sigma-70 factor (sigma-E family)
MSEEQRFAAFVRANSRSLFGTAYLLTGNRDAAEDLLQETLTRLYPKWTSVEGADSPTAYVRRSLANRFISSTRSPANRVVGLWEMPDIASDVDIASNIADRRMLWQLLTRLPERQRAALVLRYFHDLPDSEIARALDCREATVRSLISRGVAAMRDRALTTETNGGERR